MATFAFAEGGEQAYFDFLDWSRQSSKHDDEATRRERNRCRASAPRALGFGTLHYLANQHGWMPPADLAFNDKKDVSDVRYLGARRPALRATYGQRGGAHQYLHRRKLSPQARDGRWPGRSG